MWHVLKDERSTSGTMSQSGNEGSRGCPSPHSHCNFRVRAHGKVYIQTTLNVLIEINPQIRIPRTFKRFSGLMGEKKYIYILYIYCIYVLRSIYTSINRALYIYEGPTTCLSLCFSFYG